MIGTIARLVVGNDASKVDRLAVAAADNAGGFEVVAAAASLPALVHLMEVEWRILMELLEILPDHLHVYWRIEACYSCYGFVDVA